MRAGKLRAWIAIERNMGTTQDSAGEPVANWVTRFKADAEFQVVGSSEFPSFQKRYSQSTARFKMRWYDDIDPALDRIVYNGVIWNISKPQPDARRIELLIEASEFI